MNAPETPIDLRSDTVTRPSAGMRAAMAEAEVGDDQYGEDPSANRLQRRIAELLGKESALWVPTGTMANQLALRVLTRHGDDVVIATQSHAVWHESGAGAANSGVQFTEVGRGGLFTAHDFRTARKPRGHMLYPPTTLVVVENTHNRAGGIVFPQHDIERICEEARTSAVSSYLDGARLWNAAAATRRTPAELAAPFDFVSVALSKGLGAPAGSVVAGPGAMIDAALRCRRMLGGAMRQIGIFAAAATYALDHNLERLVEDHVNARLIAETLAASPRIVLDLGTVQTNIIMFDLGAEAPDAETLVARARQHGVLLNAFGPRTVRAVTHLDVDTLECGRAARMLVEIVDGWTS